MKRPTFSRGSANPFRSTTLLINPSRYPQYVKTLRRILKRVTIPRVIESRSASHFVDEVGRFCKGQGRHLLVWGGDGTAHLAINAFMRAQESGCEVGALSRKSVGFLRGGTGNGIQDSYEVPHGIWRQLGTYAESLQKDYFIDVDLLQIRTGDQESYGQLVGFGFDAEVLRAREAKKTRLADGSEVAAPGGYRYLFSALRVILSPMAQIRHHFNLLMRNGKYAYRGPRVNAEFAFEQIERDVTPAMIEVGTRPYYGKMFKVCPDVVCNDGYMELYIFNFSRKRWVVRNIGALWAGAHHKINRRLFGKNRGVIERYELTDLAVASREPFAFHVDGELRHAGQDRDGYYRVCIEVAPLAMSFIVPDRFYRLFHPFDEREIFDGVEGGDVDV